MNKSILLLCLLCLCQLQPFGQDILLTRPGTSTTTSFYSRLQQQTDALTQKNIKNPVNKIVERIENPRGTVVLDADGSLDDLKAMINTPEKVLIKENYINLPHTTAEGVTYRIPVVSHSTHHSLTQQLVVDDLQLFIRECSVRKRIIPQYVTLKHSTVFDYCEFLGYKSLSGLFEGPYYQRRLNLSCVFIHKLFPEYLAKL